MRPRGGNHQQNLSEAGPSVPTFGVISEQKPHLLPINKTAGPEASAVQPNLEPAEFVADEGVISHQPGALIDILFFDYLLFFLLARPNQTN